MSKAEGTNGCLKAFGAHDFGPQELEEYTRLIDSTKPYILFFTPRSGSSYLAELLSKTDRLGQPEEFLNQDLAPLSLKHIAETGCEIKHVIDYLTWLIRNRSSDNGVFGLKVSYGCHRPFIRAGLDNPLFGRFTPIALFRKNILKQAVSLYVAVSTGLFHTNISHSQEVLDKVRALPYDQERLRFWVQHVAVQEAAIGNYIEKEGLNCVQLTYEQVCHEPEMVIRNIAKRLNVQLGEMSCDSPTVFQKVRTKTNDTLIEQFMSDASNLSFVETLGLDESRLVGE